MKTGSGNHLFKRRENPFLPTRAKNTENRRTSSKGALIQHQFSQGSVRQVISDLDFFSDSKLSLQVQINKTCKRYLVSVDNLFSWTPIVWLESNTSDFGITTARSCILESHQVPSIQNAQMKTSLPSGHLKFWQVFFFIRGAAHKY